MHLPGTHSLCSQSSKFKYGSTQVGLGLTRRQAEEKTNKQDRHVDLVHVSFLLNSIQTVAALEIICGNHCDVFTHTHIMSVCCSCDVRWLNPGETWVEESYFKSRLKETFRCIFPGGIYKISNFLNATFVKNIMRDGGECQRALYLIFWTSL